MSTNSQTGQSRIPAQPSGEEGRLSMSDLSSLTNISQGRLSLFFGGGTALRADEELAVIQIIHREHLRFAQKEKVDRG